MKDIEELTINLEGSETVRFSSLVFKAKGESKELLRKNISWSSGAQILILFLIRYASGGSRFLEGDIARPLYEIFRLQRNKKRSLYWSNALFELFGKDLDGEEILSKIFFVSKPEGQFRIEITETFLPADRIKVSLNNTTVISIEQRIQLCCKLEGRAIPDRNSFFNQNNYDQFDSWLFAVEKDSVKIPDKSKRRLFLLKKARKYFNADYIIWGVGRYDWKAKVPICLEFFDDADDAEEFFSDVRAKNTAYLRYARIAHVINTDSSGGRFLANLTGESEDKPSHVTVERSKLIRDVHWMDKFKMLTKLGLLSLYRLSGLRDFIITASRHGDGVGSGIGYHRAKGKPPFGTVERECAHQFSLRFHEIFHTTTVNVHSISKELLDATERYAFGLLVSNFSDDHIALILQPKLSQKQINNVLKNICTKLNIPISRCALREHINVGKIQHGAKSEDNDQSLKDLLNSQN